MHDGRCRKGIAGLHVTPGDRYAGDEGHYDELQSNQRAADEPTIT